MFKSDYAPHSTPSTVPVAVRLQQCNERIAAVRTRIEALNREASMRASMLSHERSRMIGHFHVPQADWIESLERDRSVQQQQSRDAQAELNNLTALRNALLDEQQQQQQQQQ